MASCCANTQLVCYSFFCRCFLRAARTGRSHACHRSYLHMLPPTWKNLQPNYVSCCTELQETLQPELQLYTADALLGVCRPQGGFPFVLFCNRAAVEISKAQSRGTKTKEQKVTWKKTSHWSRKIHWPRMETFLKAKLVLPKISHKELKQQNGKSSPKLNII